MDHSILDDESAPFQREPKGFIGRVLLGNDPDNQRTGGSSVVRRGCRLRVAATKQIQRQLDGFGRGYDDSVLPGAVRKRNHWFNDAVA
jgi:hypothetical protein